MLCTSKRLARICFEAEAKSTEFLDIELSVNRLNVPLNILFGETMKTKHITDWKIVPSTGDTVSLIGMVNGVKTQTSPIKLARAGEVQTLNTHYTLGERIAGVWEIQLQMRRTKQYNTLQENGVL